MSVAFCRKPMIISREIKLIPWVEKCLRTGEWGGWKWGCFSTTTPLIHAPLLRNYHISKFIKTDTKSSWALSSRFSLNYIQNVSTLRECFYTLMCGFPNDVVFQRFGAIAICTYVFMLPVRI